MNVGVTAVWEIWEDSYIKCLRSKYLPQHTVWDRQCELLTTSPSSYLLAHEKTSTSVIPSLHSTRVKPKESRHLLSQPPLRTLCEHVITLGQWDMRGEIWWLREKCCVSVKRMRCVKCTLISLSACGSSFRVEWGLKLRQPFDNWGKGQELQESWQVSSYRVFCVQ